MCLRTLILRNLRIRNNLSVTALEQTLNLLSNKTSQETYSWDCLRMKWKVYWYAGAYQTPSMFFFFFFLNWLKWSGVKRPIKSRHTVHVNTYNHLFPGCSYPNLFFQPHKYRSADAVMSCCVTGYLHKCIFSIMPPLTVTFSTVVLCL